MTIHSMQSKLSYAAQSDLPSHHHPQHLRFGTLLGSSDSVQFGKGTTPNVTPPDPNPPQDPSQESSFSEFIDWLLSLPEQILNWIESVLNELFGEESKAPKQQAAGSNPVSAPGQLKVVPEARPHSVFKENAALHLYQSLTKTTQHPGKTSVTNLCKLLNEPIIRKAWEDHPAFNSQNKTSRADLITLLEKPGVSLETISKLLPVSVICQLPPALAQKIQKSLFGQVQQALLTLPDEATPLSRKQFSQLLASIHPELAMLAHHSLKVSSCLKEPHQPTQVGHPQGRWERMVQHAKNWHYQQQWMNYTAVSHVVGELVEGWQSQFDGKKWDTRFEAPRTNVFALRRSKPASFDLSHKKVFERKEALAATYLATQAITSPEFLAVAFSL